MDPFHHDTSDLESLGGFMARCLFCKAPFLKLRKESLYCSPVCEGSAHKNEREDTAWLDAEIERLFQMARDKGVLEPFLEKLRLKLLIKRDA